MISLQIQYSAVHFTENGIFHVRIAETPVIIPAGSSSNLWFRLEIMRSLRLPQTTRYSCSRSRQITRRKPVQQYIQDTPSYPKKRMRAPIKTALSIPSGAVWRGTRNASAFLSWAQGRLRGRCDIDSRKHTDRTEKQHKPIAFLLKMVYTNECGTALL